MPEGVQNVLLPAMDEGKIEIPKIGSITAENGFIIISTQNPREFIATSLLSEALRDRFELLTLDYQNENEEVAIVQQRTGINDARFVRSIVRLVRATRTHADIRRGASVRAAVSITLLANQLGPDRKTAVRSAAHMALPTRIEMKDDARKSIQEIIDELMEEHYSEEPDETPNMDPPTLNSTDAIGSNNVSPTGLTEHDATALLETLGGIADLGKSAATDLGWSIALHYGQIRRQLNDPTLLKMAKKIATRAIINRTLQLLGPIRRRMESVKQPYTPGQGGDVEIEMTAEEILGKTDIDASDLIIESNLPRKTACVMMLDTSMSMSGDKLAIATASLGVMAFKLKSIRYGVIVFDDVARPLKRLDQRVAIESLVGELLDMTARGYTNLEVGLRAGLFELNSCKAKEKVGVIVTDGNYTAGKDPSEIAAEYPKLFVIMIKSHDSKPEVCKRIASLGKGKLVAVDSFEEVPSILRSLLRDFVYHAAFGGS
jgi:Mg-chelatase subunit ChlD